MYRKDFETNRNSILRYGFTKDSGNAICRERETETISDNVRIYHTRIIEI